MNLFTHEKIILAMSVIQREEQTTKQEIVAEMAQAIHCILTFNQDDLKSMLTHIADKNNRAEVTP
jgi:hypothetical protein